MKRRTILGALCVLICSALLGVNRAAGQESNTWSFPYRLSSDSNKASEAAVVADQYGFVHAFWAEELSDNRSLLQYSRFDGNTWSTTIDIHVTIPFTPIGNISPFVDKTGILHLLWSEGIGGPAYYTQAEASDALSSRKWQPRVRINVPANRIQLVVDSKGELHALFIRLEGDDSGVYYINSKDEGQTWSEPIRLDPDIPTNWGPRSLYLGIDDSDGLHASWYYVPLDTSGGDWVRYTHSFDGGESWENPITIDRDTEGTGKLASAGPVMIVDGHTVHIIWAGGKLNYRNHRYSTDAGVTWSPTTRILGELNGQAFDGLAIDGLGRVHLFTQLRFPQGIYHSIWENDHWTPPALIYLIRSTSSEPIDDEIHAHDTFAAIRAGNQIVLTFTDPPPDLNRKLYVMIEDLPDVPPYTLEPTITPQLTPTPEVTPTTAPSRPTPTATLPIPTLQPGLSTRAPTVPTTGSAIWQGLIPSFLVVGGTVVFWLFRRRIR